MDKKRLEVKIALDEAFFLFLYCILLVFVLLNLLTHYPSYRISISCFSFASIWNSRQSKPWYILPVQPFPCSYIPWSSRIINIAVSVNGFYSCHLADNNIYRVVLKHLTSICFTLFCVEGSFDGNSMKVAELLAKNGLKEAYAIRGGIRGNKGWQVLLSTYFDICWMRSSVILLHHIMHTIPITVVPYYSVMYLFSIWEKCLLYSSYMW